MKVISKNDGSGKIVYSTEIVRSVVDCAIAEVEGVVKYDKRTRESKKQTNNYIKIDHVGDSLFIDVYIKVRYDVNVSDVASKVQSAIKTTLETMTEFVVKDINVHVIDVHFEDN
jgi:uncharacterized alkaline shock family protein YloU